MLAASGLTRVTDPATTRYGAADSFDKFRLDWNLDEALLACFSKKFADSRASSLTIISSKLIHIHADEFTGKFRAHVARVGERMAHCFVSMRQAVIDVFANNLAEIVPKNLDYKDPIEAHSKR